MRAVSTVLDVTVFLLLVSAAVTVFLVPGAPPAPDSADEVADVLVTTTASVDYETAAGSGSAKTTRSRVAHGTLAELLATAAVRNRTAFGTATATATGYRTAVANATRNALARPRTHVQVVAVWRAYDGAPVAGRFRVGSAPPADADVHVATATVPSGLPNVRTQARRVAGERGYAGVADAAASGVVRGLFPPRRTRLAMRANAPVDAAVRRRYRRFATATRFRVSGEIRNVSRTNAVLRGRVASRLEDDLRRRYESPAAAAAAVRVSRVRLTVRTWSP